MFYFVINEYAAFNATTCFLVNVIISCMSILAFVVQTTTDQFSSRSSPASSNFSSDERTLRSPTVSRCHYNYDDVDRFEAALHAVDQFVRNEVAKLSLSTADSVLKVVYEFCVDLFDKLSTTVDQCLSSELSPDLLEETVSLLLLATENCWNLHNGRMSARIEGHEPPSGAFEVSCCCCFF